jgi:acetolactate synthase-1/2/3 large subunit
MHLTGAELTIKLLERQGIEYIAGIPGGSNLPLYDALARSTITHILARHEQGAGFLAQGMARSTGRPAVCFATSGPGATNLITAIADAKADSVPLVAITGQVPLSMIGTDAFQEMDMYGLTVPITKHNFLVRSAVELLTIIPAAFRIAQSGRPGPVVVDIPKDVQQASSEVTDWPAPGQTDKPPVIDTAPLAQAAEMLNHAARPLLYIGGGSMGAAAQGDLCALAETNNIPLVSSLMGLGACPADHPLWLGMLGMHGTRATNLLLNETDLVLACGVRFDDRAVGQAARFCPQASIIHIDIDGAELGKIKQPHLSIAGDVGTVLTGLVPLVEQNDRTDWLAQVAQMQAAHPAPALTLDNGRDPAAIIRTAAASLPADTMITTDVGQHQMWTAQHYPFRAPRTFLTSGGLGTMGFGLPAAIGAALAHPGRRVVCFSGDGSLLMNVQELATLADLRLPVTIIVINNGHLGLVRQQQELFYKKNYIASRFITNPDFAAVAQACGIPGYNLADRDDTLEYLRELLTSDGPCLINAPIGPAANVFPMVPPGKSNDEMLEA